MRLIRPLSPRPALAPAACAARNSASICRASGTLAPPRAAIEHNPQCTRPTRPTRQTTASRLRTSRPDRHAPASSKTLDLHGHVALITKQFRAPAARAPAIPDLVRVHAIQTPPAARDRPRPSQRRAHPHRAYEYAASRAVAPPTAAASDAHRAASGVLPVLPPRRSTRSIPGCMPSVNCPCSVVTVASACARRAASADFVASRIWRCSSANRCKRRVLGPSAIRASFRANASLCCALQIAQLSSGGRQFAADLPRQCPRRSGAAMFERLADAFPVARQQLRTLTHAAGSCGCRRQRRVEPRFAEIAVEHLFNE